MKPELTPGSRTRNGGRPDKVASISSAMRRSASAPISAIASARVSAAKATGSAWKLPPETISACPDLASWKISGLSVTALASISRVRPALPSKSRQAPMTCGWQRRLYGSCTRSSPSRCEARMALLATSWRYICAARICPGWPRTACTRASNGASLPLAASSDSAPVTMAASSRRSAMNRPCSASAFDTCVPLISARPSFAASTTGAMPACASASGAGINSPLTRTSPTPSMARVMCDRGARSPEAPTEPLAGMAGMMPALYSAIRVSTISGRTPEKPRARLPIFISMIRRTTASDSSSPVPTECDRIRLRCNCSSFSSGMRVLASRPKPVLMP